MSTTPAPSSASHPSAAGHTTASAAHGGGHRRAGHAAAGSDQFANLLSLLSPGSDATADPLGAVLSGNTDATADGKGADATQDPLAGLLTWPADPTAAALIAQAQAHSSGAGGTHAHAPHRSTPAAAGAERGMETIASRRAPRESGNAGDPQARSTANPNGQTPLSSGQGLSPPSGPAAGQETSLPGGLQPLATPELADADTLAALRLGTNAAPAADKAPVQPPVSGSEAAPTNNPGSLPGPVRISAWRSTTTLAQAPAASHSVATPTHTSPTRLPAGDELRTGAAPNAPHASDERLAAALVPPGDGVDAGPVDAAGRPVHERETGPGLQVGTGVPDAGAANAGSGPGDPSASGQGNSGAQGDDPQQAMNPGTNGTDDPETGHWGAQHLRHAHVRVGDARDGVIDIQLSMAGQEVKVAFHTDDAQTRASLAQDASASLGDLLQRSGIELGGVSVGAQGQQHQPSGDTAGQRSAAPQPTLGRSADTQASHATPAPVAQRPRSDGSRPLDLFV